MEAMERHLGMRVDTVERITTELGMRIGIKEAWWNQYYHDSLSLMNDLKTDITSVEKDTDEL